MTKPITPPIEPMDESPDEPAFSRADVLERFWPVFYDRQMQERDRRLKSGFGVPKGLFEESLFWEFVADNNLLEEE